MSADHKELLAIVIFGVTYARFGIPVTILTTIAGLAILLLLHG